MGGASAAAARMAVLVCTPGTEEEPLPGCSCCVDLKCFEPKLLLESCRIEKKTHFRQSRQRQQSDGVCGIVVDNVAAAVARAEIVIQIGHRVRSGEAVS